MMGIFATLADELPPFKDYLKYMYDEKVMALVGSSITDHQYRKLRGELFNPTNPDDIDSTEISLELGQLAARPRSSLRFATPRRRPHGTSRALRARWP